MLFDVEYLRIGFSGKVWWNLISSLAPGAADVSGTETAVKKNNDLLVAATTE